MNPPPPVGASAETPKLDHAQQKALEEINEPIQITGGHHLGRLMHAGWHKGKEMFKSAVYCSPQWCEGSPVTPEHFTKQLHSAFNNTYGLGIAPEAVGMMREALESITRLNGNLPDSSLDGKCGPNEGAARGLNLMAALKIARAALAKAKEGVRL